MLKTNKTLFKGYRFLLLFTLFLQQAYFANAQGLQFASGEALVAKRTSYTVFKNDPPVFNDHLYINFDLSLWRNVNFGYIFNEEVNGNSYSLSYLSTNQKTSLNFNIDRVSNKLRIPLQDIQLEKSNWLKIRVDLQLANDKVVIYVNNKKYTATGFGFKNNIPAKLIFGKNQYYTEVPNMAIKNLYVADNTNSYFFPLNEWEGNAVHNSNHESAGWVENPEWLINEYYFWKPVYNHSFSEVAGLNFDADRQDLFFYQRDSLYIYDVKSGQQQVLPYKNQLPIKMVLGKSIFNSKEDKCYVYEAHFKENGQPSVSALDMKTLTWQTIGKGTLPQQRHHHNTFYNASQDTIFLFGGYGMYRYYNNFYKYNTSIDTWELVPFKGDTINPRFFSASGSTGNPDEVFIFGGYGNESGNQIVGGKQLYDLYRVNLKTHTIKKSWEIHPRTGKFVAANNLILSKDKKYIYALCYPHELAKSTLSLYKFSVKDGSYEIVSSPIPIISEKIETDINLFYNDNTNKFYCSIQEFTDPPRSSVKVYSLSGPPVSTALYLQSHIAKKLMPLNLICWALAGLILLAPFITAWVLLKNKRRKEAISYDALTAENETAIDKHELENKKNAVYLLGEFVVFSKNGKDITYLFSPKIRQLFLLILLNSKNGNGVNSKKISHALWPDKDVAKTKNIKGVTFNHLRNILSDINGIELVFNDAYSFQFDSTFFCDYFFVNGLLKEPCGADCDELLSKHFSLVSRGMFLGDMTDPWLDDIKVVYEDMLIEVTSPQLQKLYTAEEYKHVLKLAKLILAIDPFNDIAFKYQLKSLKRLRGIEYAKKVYDHFSIEYRKSLDIDYHLNFDKILH